MPWNADPTLISSVLFLSFAFSFGVYYQNKTKTIKIIKPQQKKHYKNQNITKYIKKKNLQKSKYYKWTFSNS